MRPQWQGHWSLHPAAGVDALGRESQRRDAGAQPGHDPLFEFHRWQANLRILDVSEIETVPHVPLSHPFVERVIGTVRRELLDQVPFWRARDLERKLRHFRDYYNHNRVHASLKGVTPICSADHNVIDLDGYRWRSHCRGLYQLPVAA